MAHQLNEEECPVSESILGQLYRASPHGLTELIDRVPAATRAMLAVYCYRRAHLASIGLAIAASCDQQELEVCGNIGSDLFAKSRGAHAIKPLSNLSQRRKITLASGPLMAAIAQDLI